MNAIDKAVDQFRTLLEEQIARAGRMKDAAPAKDFTHLPTVTIGVIDGDTYNLIYAEPNILEESKIQIPGALTPPRVPEMRPDEDALSHAVAEANHAIYTESRRDPLKAGMGTTLTAAIIEDNRLLMTEEQYANTNNSSWKLENKADGIFTNSPKKQGYILEGDLAGNCWEPGNQPEILFGLMNDYDKEFLAAYGYKKFGDFVNPPIELAKYGEAWQINYDPVDKEHTKFLQVQDQRLPEMIMCDPAEFDAKWDAFVEEIGPSAKAFEDYMQQAVLAEAEKVLGK